MRYLGEGGARYGITTVLVTQCVRESWVMLVWVQGT